MIENQIIMHAEAKLKLISSYTVSRFPTATGIFPPKRNVYWDINSCSRAGKKRWELFSAILNHSVTGIFPPKRNVCSDINSCSRTGKKRREL